MQPSRRPLALVVALALALALPGCTFPWQRTQESIDADSNYESGAGAKLVVRNEGNQTFDVKLWLRDPYGKVIGQSNLTLDPGEEATRRFATPVRGDHQATLQYSFSGLGHAASGIDDQVLSTGDCGELRTGSWTLSNVEKSAASQWRDEGCQAP